DERLLQPSDSVRSQHCHDGSAHHRYGTFTKADKDNYFDSNENTQTRRDDQPRGSIFPIADEDSGGESPGNHLVRGLSDRKTNLNIINLTYTVKEKPGHWWNRRLLSKSKDKIVLKNISMTFTRGEITAIVGTSGSGKTSLLDVISGRAEGKVDGVVSYKHQQCRRAMMRQKASYVLQADRLLPTLTVRETLTYMALMKLPGSLRMEEIDQKVQRVMCDMGLTHVADSRIGGAVVRGVSGGEKRRITIGVQLLKDPEIVLLDEPTSGLDSFTARHLVSTLVELAHKGDKLILMTVHQPRSDIVNMLDKIAILTSGQLAYLGPPSQMVPFFTSIGHPCPKNQNPCDVYIDITSVDRRNPGREQETLARANAICRDFEQSQLHKDLVENNALDVTTFHRDVSKAHSPPTHSQSPSWFRVFRCLLERMNVHLWRERSRLIGRFVQQAFFVPFLILFIGRVGDGVDGIQDRLGLIYQAVSSSPYLALTNAVAIFPILRDTYYRESHDGMYSTATFLTAYYVHSLPFNIISGALFSTFLYWVVGFKDDLVIFAMFMLIIIIMAQFGEMVAVGLMGTIRSVQLACDSTALLFNTSAFFGSGLIRSLATMPTVLRQIGYIAIHRYSTETVLANEFQDLKLACSDGKHCVYGNDFINSLYPGAFDHITRNFCVMGGYTLIVLAFAILCFKARGIPTLH
ncbi:hypothetical protein EGW08_011249, partial [Elysia chlorotica]